MIPSHQTYLVSWQKRLLDLVVSLSVMLVGLPIWLVLAIMIWITAGWPFYFVQKRVGRGGALFLMYKFKTMRNGAAAKQESLMHLNEADGPVFKISNDPRFVGIGRWLSQTGLDELPQLINVLKGEMSLVGPRPLPVSEEKKIKPPFRLMRQAAKPGMVSRWVFEGGHAISFADWMLLDKKYQDNSSLRYDLYILLRCGKLFVTIFTQKIKRNYIFYLIASVVLVGLLSFISESLYIVNTRPDIVNKVKIDLTLKQVRALLFIRQGEGALETMVTLTPLLIPTSDSVNVSLGTSRIDADLNVFLVDIISRSETITQRQTNSNQLARDLYTIGLALYPKDAELALKLWSLSVNLAPSWSYFYLEQANLLSISGHISQAQEILDRCAENSFARDHCVALRSKIVSEDSGYGVGFLSQEIQSIK